FMATVTPEISTLSLHDALPISDRQLLVAVHRASVQQVVPRAVHGLQRHFLAFGALHLEHVLAIVRPVAGGFPQRLVVDDRRLHLDRKSTRLNSSHLGISYAVFC